jgi:hypothetical protein
VNPHQLPGGPGPARQGSGRWTDFSGSTHPRTRQVGDLFRPVTSSEPPAAAIAGQPVTPLLNGRNQDGEPVAAPAPQSGSASGARRWADLRPGLLAGTPGAVIALVASAALVLVVAGMTMSTTSSSTESAVAGPAPGRLPAPAPPAISDDHLVTVSPVDASAGLARQAPANASSPALPPVHQQAVPRTNGAALAPLAPPRTPDHGLVSPPPPPPPLSPPPSTVTTEDAGYWTITTGSHPEKAEPPTADTEPCNCDIPKRNLQNYRDRPSQADRQRERRAQRARYRSTSTTQQSGVSEKEEQGRPAAPPDAEAGRRSSLH